MAFRSHGTNTLIIVKNNSIIMPFVVTHMLLPMILIDIFRDNILKIKKSKLPNKYILIAGLAGLLPDIDIPLSAFFPTLFAHRTITHTVWVPLLFLLISSVFYLFKKHNWSKIFLMCFIGTSIHIILDGVIAGSIYIFYPLNEKIALSVNLIGTANPLFAYSVMDAVLLWIWFFRKMISGKRIEDIV
jgi:membrane-bound metal-dependent hydrolase YbcI (DUF457 family)